MMLTAATLKMSRETLFQFGKLASEMEQSFFAFSKSYILVTCMV